MLFLSVHETTLCFEEVTATRQTGRRPSPRTAGRGVTGGMRRPIRQCENPCGHDDEDPADMTISPATSTAIAAGLPERSEIHSFSQARPIPMASMVAA